MSKTFDTNIYFHTLNGSTIIFKALKVCVSAKKVLNSTKSINSKLKAESFLKLKPLLIAHIGIDQIQRDSLAFKKCIRKIISLSFEQSAKNILLNEHNN